MLTTNFVTFFLSVVQIISSLVIGGYRMKLVLIPPLAEPEPIPYNETIPDNTEKPPYIVLDIINSSGEMETRRFEDEDAFADYLDESGLLTEGMTAEKWRALIDTRRETIYEQHLRDARIDFWDAVKNGTIKPDILSDGIYDYEGAWENYTRNNLNLDDYIAPINDEVTEWMTQFP